MPNLEEEYFSREEAEKIRKIHAERIKKEATKQLIERKKTHWMKCGKCGWDLQTITWRQIEVDKCFHCGVILLDDGELEKLAGQESDGSFIHSLFDLLKK